MGEVIGSKKFVRGSGEAVEYVNAQLEKVGEKPIKAPTFLKHVRNKDVVSIPVPGREGGGTRYDFYLTDLDDYVNRLTSPRGKPVTAKSRFNWFGLNE